jgi:colanic acid/amylovoran biosynthesis glycosyltransferase
MHPGAAEIRNRTIYLPRGLTGELALAAATFAALAAFPGRALSALGWSLGARRHERGSLRAFAEAAYLRRRLAADVDHVHAHFAHTSASLALLISRLTRLPFSFTGHAKDIFDASEPALLRRKTAAARFVVAVSEYSRRHLAEIAREADARKIVVVRNGVDRRRFRRREEQPTAKPVVATVARLVEKKGVGVLIAAAGLLASRGVAAHFEVVGDGPLRLALEGLARDGGVTRAVTFQGSRDSNAVAQLLARATLFVLPSVRATSGDEDALPVSLVEAMACGVPVVTTPVGGIPELVEDGESGLLVPPDDPRALADAIERLLGDAALRTRLRAGGYEATADYDLSESVRRLRRLFASGPER